MRVTILATNDEHHKVLSLCSFFQKNFGVAGESCQPIQKSTGPAVYDVGSLHVISDNTDTDGAPFTEVVATGNSSFTNKFVPITPFTDLKPVVGYSGSGLPPAVELARDILKASAMPNVGWTFAAEELKTVVLKTLMDYLTGGAGEARPDTIVKVPQ